MGNFTRKYNVYKVNYILPAKETKLLQKLLRTRGVYDETRSRILSNSLTSLGGKAIVKRKKNLPTCDVQKIKAVVDLVSSVDKSADLSNTVKNTSRSHCCAGGKTRIRSRDKSTQVKKLKSCCDPGRMKLKQNERHFKLNQVHSDPCKLEGAVQRTRCQTTCIQVLQSVNGRETPKIYSCTKIKGSCNNKNLMKSFPRINMILNNFTRDCSKVSRRRSNKIDSPKGNLYKNLCDMCKQVKQKKCKTCMLEKPVIIECCKNNVKTKNAFIKTSSKTKHIKSLANVNTEKCCANPCNKNLEQNLYVGNKTRKKSSKECCRMKKPKRERATVISNICCSLQAKPCGSNIVKKKNSKTIGCQNISNSVRKKASQVKIHFIKKGTCQAVREVRCGFQCRPKITKSRNSHRSGSIRKRKSKERRDLKRRRNATTVRSQCKCDNNTQTKFCKKCSKPKLKSYYCVGKISTSGGLNGAKCSKINKNKGDRSCCMRFNRREPKGDILCQQHIQSECIIHEIHVKKSRRCPPCSKQSCCSKPEEKRVTTRSKKVNTGKVKVRSISSISAQTLRVKAKKVQSIVQKPKKETAERQAVRIGSTCSFDIEFYKGRSKGAKPVEKCEKKKKSRGSIANLKSFVKKFNKSTKTKQTCCVQCYFVDIYRYRRNINKIRRKSEMTVSCSTGSLKSSVLSSVDCLSNDSTSIQIEDKRLNKSEDYLSYCRKSLSTEIRKLSDLYYLNEERNVCSTRFTENISKNGSNINLQAKLCSETYFGDKLQPKKEKVLSPIIYQSLENKHNFFFRKLCSALFPNVSIIKFYTTNVISLVRQNKKVEDFSMKHNFEHKVFDVNKYCNWALKTCMEELNLLKTIIKICCRLVFLT